MRCHGHTGHTKVLGFVAVETECFCEDKKGDSI